MTQEGDLWQREIEDAVKNAGGVPEFNEVVADLQFRVFPDLLKDILEVEKDSEAQHKLKVIDQLLKRRDIDLFTSAGAEVNVAMSDRIKLVKVPVYDPVYTLMIYVSRVFANPDYVASVRTEVADRFKDVVLETYDTYRELHDSSSFASASWKERQ